MSQIRRLSIISTIIIFCGFGIGFINNLFFTNVKWFTEVEYGLTRSFVDFGQLVFAFSFLGLSVAIYKFSPYYKAYLKDKENDLLSWSLLFATIGFLLFCIVAYLFRDFFEKKYIAKSPELVHYYFWIFPYAYFLLVFNFLESYLWTLHKSTLSNFLRELILRVYHFVIIVFFILKIITYDQFIKMFVFTYALLIIIVVIYLKSKGKFVLTFNMSKVTRRLLKKILSFTAFVYVGILITTLASLNDSITISSFIGQAGLGIFAITSYISTVIQVPQRSVIAVTIPVLAEAWREKNLGLIQKIYARSSINLLLVSLIIFGVIWLSYSDAIHVFHMKDSYLEGKYLFLFLGIKVIVDMGTGINSQIIGTSNFWKFEFITGIILLLIVAPLNYFLIKKMGLVGAGISNLIAYSVYNAIRLYFLWKKFGMFPFSWKTLYSLFFGVIFYFIVFYSFQSLSGWSAIFIKSFLFMGLMVAAILICNLTPDAKPILKSLQNRLKK